MTVRFSKRFVKQLSRLPKSVQEAAFARIRLALDTPDHPLLRRHHLTGRLKHLYSINITGDVRALYEVIDNQMVIYQMIGTHSQLYG